MRQLIQAGPQGLSSGALASGQGINASTASAQLAVLSQSGLVSATRDGKQIIYRAEFARFQKLIAFLMEDCCAGPAS